jgi:hypothetical protein
MLSFLTSSRRARGLSLALLGLSAAVPVGVVSSRSIAIPDMPSASVTAETAEVAQLPLPTETTINVEGSPITIALAPYRPDGVPIEMAVPVGRFTPSVTTRESGTELRLNASYEDFITEDAYMAIVWPEPAIDFEEGLARITGPGGWADRENIELIDGTVAATTPGSTFYPWERVRWNFQSETEDGFLMSGQVVLGQIDGQTFWVVTQLPGEFVEGYAPLMDVVAETLRGR